VSIVKSIGHVSSDWRGRDLLLRYDNRGQTEQVAESRRPASSAGPKPHVASSAS
jgi:hypothetical protein